MYCTVYNELASTGIHNYCNCWEIGIIPSAFVKGTSGDF